MTRIRAWARFLGISMAVFAVDRITKIAATAALASGQSVPVAPNIFHLTIVRNTGAAFGLMKDQRLFFIFISILAIVFSIQYIWKNRDAGFIALLAFGLITGGALGNLLDRIKYGYVIDFLDFRIWPVFNIADSAISIGVVLLSWLILTKN